MTPALPSPLTVAYDIARLSAGGANGGIKVHHYEFMRRFVEKHSHEIRLFVFCREEIVPELSFLSVEGFHQVHVLGPRKDYEPRSSDGSLPLLRYWAELPEDLLSLLEVDVLYAGFGFSELYTPKVPQVSLIVDVLHRSFPESLPPAEVTFRDRWYAEAIERSALVQTNSEFCKRQLINEFGADPEKVFTIALPLHGRFNKVEMGALPAQIAHLPHKYFLYPANFWPHKNHDRLLEAYALYREDKGREALHLVLTGSLNERGKEIAGRISELGLDGFAHMIGHLDLASYKAVWELAHSLVFPSLYEGFGLPLLEATVFRKPVACSAQNYNQEALVPRCLLVSPFNTIEWQNALAKLGACPSDYRSSESDTQNINFETEIRKLITSLRNNVSQSRKVEPTNA